MPPRARQRQIKLHRWTETTIVQIEVTELLFYDIVNISISQHLLFDAHAHRQNTSRDKIIFVRMLRDGSPIDADSSDTMAQRFTIRANRAAGK